MIRLIFGMIWTVLYTVILIMLYVSGNEGARNHEMMDILLAPTIMLIFFILIGISISVFGVKSIKKSKRMDRDGILTYGVVRSVRATQRLVDNVDKFYGLMMLEAEFVMIKPNGTTQVFSRYVGDDISKFRVGNIIEIRYLEPDIEIVSERVLDEDVPFHFMDKIKEVRSKYCVFSPPMGNEVFPNPYSINGEHSNNNYNNTYYYNTNTMDRYNEIR